MIASWVGAVALASGVPLWADPCAFCAAALSSTGSPPTLPAFLLADPGAASCENQHRSPRQHPVVMKYQHTGGFSSCGQLVCSAGAATGAGSGAATRGSAGSPDTKAVASPSCTSLSLPESLPASDDEDGESLMDRGALRWAPVGEPGRPAGVSGVPRRQLPSGGVRLRDRAYRSGERDRAGDRPVRLVGTHRGLMGLDGPQAYHCPPGDRLRLRSGGRYSHGHGGPSGPGRPCGGGGGGGGGGCPSAPRNTAEDSALPEKTPGSG